MANKIRGEVDFEAGGKTYTLKMSTNAICQIEDLSGKSINEFSQGLFDPALFRIANLRLIFFACLLGGKSEVASLLDAGEILDAVGFEDGGVLIRTAYQRAFPTPEEGDGEDSGKQKATS